MLMDESWRPEQRCLYEYWHSKRPSDAALPGRQHVDPLEIPSLLPHLFLIDVVREPLRFRYGSNFRGRLCFAPTV